MADIFSTMYKLTAALIINDHVVDLSASDIISISMVLQHIQSFDSVYKQICQLFRKSMKLLINYKSEVTWMLAYIK